MHYFLQFATALLSKKEVDATHVLPSQSGIPEQYSGPSPASRDMKIEPCIHTEPHGSQWGATWLKRVHTHPSVELMAGSEPSFVVLEPMAELLPSVKLRLVLSFWRV